MKYGVNAYKVNHMIPTIHNVTPKMVNLLCSFASSKGKLGNSGVLIFKPIKVINRMTSITPTNGPGVKGLKSIQTLNLVNI